MFKLSLLLNDDSQTHVKALGIFLAVGFGDALILNGFEDPRHVRYEGQGHARVPVRSESHHFLGP